MSEPSKYKINLNNSEVPYGNIHNQIIVPYKKNSLPHLSNYTLIFNQVELRYREMPLKCVARGPK